MIEAKTCLVLGAGASAPYGLPTATELRDLILVRSSIDGTATAWKYRIQKNVKETARETWESPVVDEWDHRLISVADGDSRQEALLERLRTKFFLGRTLSIDKFLQHPENAGEFGELGRRLIAAVLLKCENQRLLDKGWYAELFSQIAPNNPDDLRSGMLSVVTFNYDRSFEIYLWTAFRETFRLSRDQLGDVWRRIRITHAYGYLGDLGERDYGTEKSSSIPSVIEAAKGIELMRIGHPAEKMSEINQCIEEADTVCFIGFGFAPENIALFDGIKFRNKRLVATSLGLSKNRMAAAKKTFGKAIEFVQGDGQQLLQETDIFRAAKTKEASPIAPTRGPEEDGNWVTMGRGWKV